MTTAAIPTTRTLIHPLIIRSMKPIFLSLLLGSLGLAIAGCNRSVAETETHVHTPAATYKEGHGLKLSPGGARFVALASADVVMRDVGVAKAVAAIPAGALLRTVKGDFVFVANGEWYLRTPISVGAREGEWLEAREGLYEGDRVVVQGTRDLWLAEIQAVNGGVGCADGH